jgi:hypothetical protein
MQEVTSFDQCYIWSVWYISTLYSRNISPTHSKHSKTSTASLSHYSVPSNQAYSLLFRDMSLLSRVWVAAERMCTMSDLSRGMALSLGSYKKDRENFITGNDKVDCWPFHMRPFLIQKGSSQKRLVLCVLPMERSYSVSAMKIPSSQNKRGPLNRWSQHWSLTGQALLSRQNCWRAKPQSLPSTSSRTWTKPHIWLTRQV